MTIKKFCSLISILVMVLIYSSAWAQEGRKLERIRVAVPSRSVTYFPMIIAKQRGFYQRHGVNVELILMRPTIMTQALLSGDLDLSTVFTRDMSAVLSGMSARIVMAMNTGPSHHLVVMPEIRSVKDLRGRTLGIDGPKQLLEVLILKGLEKYGLVPGRDVKLLPMGGAGSDARLTALLTGRLDGTLLTAPHTTIALKQGFNILFAAREVSKMASAGLTATLQKLQNEPKPIIGTIAAILEATQLLKKNKGEFIKLLAEETGIKDRDAADHIYDDFMSVASETGTTSDESMMESIAFVKDLLGITREVAIAEVADWTFAQKALRALKEDK